MILLILLMNSGGVVRCGNVVEVDAEEVRQLDLYLKKSKPDLENSQLALLAFKETSQMLILTKTLSSLSITPRTIFYSAGFIGNTIVQLNASEIKFTSLANVFNNSTRPYKVVDRLTSFCSSTLSQLYQNNTFIPNYYICFFKTTLTSENRVFFSTTSEGFRCLKLNSDGDVITKDVSKGFIEDFATSLCVITIIFIALLWVQGSFKRRIIDTKRYPFTNYYFGNDTDWNSSTFSDLSVTLRPIFPFFKHLSNQFDKLYKLIFRSIQNKVDQEHIRKYKKFGSSTLLKYQLFFDFFLFIVISCLSMVQLFVPSVLYFPNFIQIPINFDLENDETFTSYWIGGADFVPISLGFWLISLTLMILGIILLIVTSSSKEKMMYWSTNSLPDTNILVFTDAIFKIIFIVLINVIIILLPFWTFTIKGVLMVVITIASIFYGSQQILIPTEKVIHAIHDGNYKMVVAFLMFAYFKELLVIIPFFIQIFMVAETIFGLVWSLILSFVANNSKLSLIGIFGIVINSATSLLQDLLQPSRVTRKKIVERSDTFVFPSLTKTSTQFILDNVAAKYGGIINTYSKLVESNENVDYTYKDILSLNDNLEELKDITRKRSQSVGKSENGEAKLAATTIEKIHNPVNIKFEKNEDKNEEELKTRYTEINDRPKYMHVLFKKEIALLVRGIFLSTQEKKNEKLRVIFKRGERLYTPLLNTDIRRIHHNLVGRVKIATGNLSNYLVLILIAMIIFLSFTYSGAESDGMDIMSNMAIVISIFIPQLFGRLDEGQVDELFERRIEETILLTKRDLAKKLDLPEKDLNFCIFNFQNDSDISNFLEHNTPAVSETIGRKM